MFTDRKDEFVVGRQILQKTPGPLEIQARGVVQQQVGLERSTNTVSVLHVRSWPAGMNPVIPVNTQQQAGTEQRYQRRCLQLVRWRLDEQAYLLRRLATAALDPAAAGVAKISRVELAYAVVGQPGAGTDRTRPCLVPDHPEGEFELAAFAGVSVIGKAHILYFMIVLDQIW